MFLESDPNCPNLLPSLVHDTKSIHHLSICQQIKVQWTEVSKAVYNFDSGKVEYLRFVRMNTMHKNNTKMAGVDSATEVTDWASGYSIENGDVLFYFGELASPLIQHPCSE